MQISDKIHIFIQTVIQTHVKFLLAKTMRESFALSRTTVGWVWVFITFLQKLRSRFGLKLSNVPVLARLQSTWLGMPVSSLMGTLALAVCKLHYPFGGGSGDVVLQETLLRSRRWDVAVHGSGNACFQTFDSPENTL